MTNRQLDEEAIFYVARELFDPVIRDTYLNQICGGDQAVATASIDCSANTRPSEACSHLRMEVDRPPLRHRFANP